MSIASVWCDRIVIIVAPFSKVVCELKTGSVSGGIFEVDNNKLFMRVGWKKERRFAGRLEPEDIAVLSLESISSRISHSE